MFPGDRGLNYQREAFAEQLKKGFPGNVGTRVVSIVSLFPATSGLVVLPKCCNLAFQKAECPAVSERKENQQWRNAVFIQASSSKVPERLARTFLKRSQTLISLLK